MTTLNIYTPNDAALTARGQMNNMDAVRRAIREGRYDEALRHMRDGREYRLKLEWWLMKQLAPYLEEFDPQDSST